MKKDSTKGELVKWYAEDLGARLIEISSEAFERVLGRKSGVYVLSRKKEPYYVGLASELRKRLPWHLKDRLRNKWDRFSFYATKAKHMKDLETLLIRVVDPRGNHQKGQFGKGRNLKRKFKTEVKREFNKLIGDK